MNTRTKFTRNLFSRWKLSFPENLSIPILIKKNITLNHLLDFLEICIGSNQA